MRSRNLIGMIALAASFAACGAQAQELSKLPDWSGQWKNTSGIQWDQTRPLGPAQGAMLTAEYQARYEVNLRDQAAGGLGDDPTGQCIPHGMPRVMTVVYPMEIVITPKTTYVLTDYTIPRRIFTDGRDWPQELDQNFNGTSIGRWVDPDAEGRFTALLVRDEITVIDHALTRPWTVTKRYSHESDPTPIWHFNDCAEDNHHVVLGKDSYFITSDGKLMPTKKGQKPPDLRYFQGVGK